MYRARELGSGSYGQVVVAYDADGRESAAKVFEDGICNETVCELGFLRLLNRAGAPHVIEARAVSLELDGQPAVVLSMPIFGRSLDSYLTCLSKTRALDIGHKLLACLGYLHSSTPPILHRDVKLGNILVDASLDVKLIDFSFATFHVDATKDDGVLGTPTYIAPEVIQSCAYSEKSDVYALGVVFFEMFRREELNVDRDKAALRFIQDELGRMNHSPGSVLLKSMLHQNPAERLTASRCQELPAFSTKAKIAAPAPLVFELTKPEPSLALKRAIRPLRKRFAAETLALAQNYVNLLGCDPLAAVRVADLVYERRGGHDSDDEKSSSLDEAGMVACLDLLCRLDFDVFSVSQQT